jgi:PPK2 family polyphosphate:nucleotide phosphotransferase
MSVLLNSPSIAVRERSGIKLSDFATDHPAALSKKELRSHLEDDRKVISDLQKVLYASDNHSLLLVFQAMDAAGKDSCIRHVLSGVNPQGCSVHSFKAPTSNELEHDFLWRHASRTPQRGMIGIHNRSHYEEVLVVKVHPEYVLGQRIPGITSVDDIDHDFWAGRYQSIREFEAHLARQGTVIMKFFLHMGKEQQKERFLERINTPEKNWKFSSGDIKERGYWDSYMQAYEEAIGETAAPHAPWFIVPADDQWETRAIVGRLVREQLEEMGLRHPALSDRERMKMAEAKAQLESEE